MPSIDISSYSASRYKDQPAVKSGHVTYKEKKLWQKSKQLNMRKRAVKSEEVTDSAALRKAKHFLKTVEAEADDFTQLKANGERIESEADDFTQLKANGERIESEADDFTKLKRNGERMESEDNKDGLLSQGPGSGVEGLVGGMEQDLNGDVKLMDSDHEEVYKTPSVPEVVHDTPSNTPSVPEVVHDTPSVPEVVEDTPILHQDVHDTPSEEQGADVQTMDHTEERKTYHPNPDTVAMWREIASGGAIDDNKVVKRKRRRRKGKKCVPMPADVAGDDELRKYWAQRYRLFSRFDDGIKLDRGW